MIDKFRSAVAYLGLIDLDSQKSLLLFKVGAPIFFGLFSVWLGVDANWDLQNYHLYNAFAALNGKLYIDLAPASIQTFFNPTIDVPYYLMHQFMPAPLVGFVMGAVHGLLFVLVLGIAQFSLRALPPGDHIRVPILLAVAGCLTGNFLSGLGNTMGDNFTALFVLGGLFVTLQQWEALCAGGRRTAAVAVGAGVLVGLGVGLKLTNAVFAVGLCLAYLAVPGRVHCRAGVAFVFGIGVLAGIAVTGGWWLWTMWQHFGNPLFPQFGNLFPNPLAQLGGVADMSWLPKDPIETVLWPFIFSFNPSRVGQIRVLQIIWALAYALFWCWLLLSIFRVKGHLSAKPLDPRARFVVAFVVFGYIAWVTLFSIYRYVVSIEAVAPLMVFILLTSLFKYTSARKMAAYALTASALLAVGSTQSNSGNWGHESWANPAYRVQLPRLPDPSKITVVTVSGDPPWAWLVPSFPKEVAFVGLPLFVMDTPAFMARAHKIIDDRGGSTFAIVEGHVNGRVRTIAKANAIGTRLGLTTTETGCSLLRWVSTRFKLRATYEDTPLNARVRCQLVMLASDQRDLTIPLQASIDKVEPVYSRYGFAIDRSSCLLHSSYIGQKEIAYQWCQINRDNQAKPSELDKGRSEESLLLKLDALGNNMKSKS